MVQKQPSVRPDSVSVTFRVPGSVWADRFVLVGDFTGREVAYPMKRSAADPDWHIRLDVPVNRQIRFRYLCDDREWNYDFGADGWCIDSQGQLYCLLDTTPDWVFPVEPSASPKVLERRVAGDLVPLPTVQPA